MRTAKKKAVKKKTVKKTVKKRAVKKKTVKRTRTNKKAAPQKKTAKDGTDRGRKKQVLSRAMLKQLEAAASMGCTYHEMAMHIGIDKDTLRRCRDEQSGVQNLIDAAKARGCVKAKNRLFQVATVPVSQFKPVNWSALQYFLNNNTEYSTKLELGEGQNIPNDVDINDEEAVTNYLKMIKKPD